MASLNMITGREVLLVMSTDLDLSTSTIGLSSLQLHSFCWPASMYFDRLLLLMLLQCNKVFTIHSLNTTAHYESDVLI